mmetsp:Transcript_65211/g.183559  ORF Transcript_65211/g.183559 Transcript_65211/m.183559 type:complete len:508 (+) Transcript_65211:25-1548(+)
MFVRPTALIPLLNDGIALQIPVFLRTALIEVGVDHVEAVVMDHLRHLAEEAVAHHVQGGPSHPLTGIFVKLVGVVPVLAPHLLHRPLARLHPLLALVKVYDVPTLRRHFQARQHGAAEFASAPHGLPLEAGREAVAFGDDHGPRPPGARAHPGDKVRQAAPSGVAQVVSSQVGALTRLLNLRVVEVPHLPPRHPAGNVRAHDGREPLAEHPDCLVPPAVGPQRRVRARDQADAGAPAGDVAGVLHRHLPGPPAVPRALGEVQVAHLREPRPRAPARGDEAALLELRARARAVPVDQHPGRPCHGPVGTHAFHQAQARVVQEQPAVHLEAAHGPPPGQHADGPAPHRALPVHVGGPGHDEGLLRRPDFPLRGARGRGEPQHPRQALGGRGSDALPEPAGPRHQLILRREALVAPLGTPQALGRNMHWRHLRQRLVPRARGTGHRHRQDQRQSCNGRHCRPTVGRQELGGAVDDGRCLGGHVHSVRLAVPGRGRRDQRLLLRCQARPRH